MTTLIRAPKILVAAGIVLAMMGASDPGCATKKDPSKRPPAQQQVDPMKARRATISVHGDGPYTVIRTATGPGVDGPVTEKHTDHVARGEYQAGYDYDSGTLLAIEVRVSGHTKNTFDCVIEDSVPGNRSTNRGLGGAYCKLLTQG